MAKKQLNIRIEETILDKLEELSKQTGKTKTQFIEQITRAKATSTTTT